jgi:hypothetical protein
MVIAEIEKFRKSQSSRQWELPPWGHPVSQGILPLFIIFENRLIPVGTAFTVGTRPFVITADHNIREALKHEPRLEHLLIERSLPEAISLHLVGISVLHQRPNQNGGIDFTLWPLETMASAPPTDVVLGSPRFQTSFKTLVHRVSFDLPSIGERVLSIGYTFPKDLAEGIPLSDISGAVDWKHDYSHKLLVVEGFVKRIFTQRFSDGFVRGPCFTFDAEITHAQSGGPVLSSEGLVRGVNSAGASICFDSPTSIASLLYPVLLVQLRYGVTIGPVRMNVSRPLVSLISQGVILTDGSEERVFFAWDEVNSSFRVNPRGEVAMSEYVHDDFQVYQEQRSATQASGGSFRLRKVEDSSAQGG